jgi:hypothetical protein
MSESKDNHVAIFGSCESKKWIIKKIFGIGYFFDSFYPYKCCDSERTYWYFNINSIEKIEIYKKYVEILKSMVFIGIVIDYNYSDQFNSIFKLLDSLNIKYTILNDLDNLENFIFSINKATESIKRKEIMNWLNILKTQKKNQSWNSLLKFETSTRELNALVKWFCFDIYIPEIVISSLHEKHLTIQDFSNQNVKDDMFKELSIYIYEKIYPHPRHISYNTETFEIYLWYTYIPRVKKLKNWVPEILGFDLNIDVKIKKYPDDICIY